MYSQVLQRAFAETSEPETSPFTYLHANKKAEKNQLADDGDFFNRLSEYLPYYYIHELPRRVCLCVCPSVCLSLYLSEK